MKSIDDLRTQMIAVKCSSKEECEQLKKLVGMESKSPWSSQNCCIRFCPPPNLNFSGNCNTSEESYYKRNGFTIEKAQDYLSLKPEIYEIY